MRNEFAKVITKLAMANPDIILLSGDIGNRLFDTLKKEYSNQFVNCGVAEANMIGVACGLGMGGFKPFVYTITPFVTTRCLEQIRVDLAYHDVPVTIVGTGSGLSYASLGPTHHSLEDFAIFRAIPNINIYAPWDRASLRTCLSECLKSDGPNYIRIGKKGEPEITENRDTLGVSGHYQIGSEGKLAIISIGTIASECLIAREILERKKIKTTLYLFQQVKPFPIQSINEVLSRHKHILVVEEHSKTGGFGESIKSFICDNNLQKNIINLGTDDMFLPSIGSQSFARTFFKIDCSAIANAGLSLMNRP